MSRLLSFLFACLLALLAGCASQAPAPVADRSAGVAAPAVAAAAAVELKPGHYLVKKGDTLYRIALDHGLDYKDVVAWNNIDNPNRIEAGQQLRVVPPEGGAVVRPVAASAPVEVKPVTASAPSVPWIARSPVTM